LSRGLVLVKWWLLALAQYLVLAFLVGGGTFRRSDGDTEIGRPQQRRLGGRRCRPGRASVGASAVVHGPAVIVGGCACWEGCCGRARWPTCYRGRS
jgi:hypothetical protein